MKIAIVKHREEFQQVLENFTLLDPKTRGLDR
jgi:hypothetical protein